MYSCATCTVTCFKVSTVQEMERTPPEEARIPSAGELIGGKYRVEHRIGQGGMGAVLAARNTVTGKRVAIKWLLPEHAGSVVRERLLREAQLAASIEHPNVVNIYDVGEHEGGLFLVMEYLPGRTLSALMIERGRFNPPEFIALLLPAMRGVHAAHLAGVVHRDLKPDNIILSEADGEVVAKVVDFGISKEVGVSAVPNASLTRTGTLVGTPHYMAFEQIDGSGYVDARTDVYAFGVLLYRGITGMYPFDGTSVAQLILNIGMKEAKSMRLARPELPAELDAIVLRALSRDLRARFASLEELGRALVPFALSAETAVPTSWQGSWKPDVTSAPELIVENTETTISLMQIQAAPPPAPKGKVAGRRGVRVGVAVIVATIAALLLLGQLASNKSPDPHGSSALAKVAKQTEARDPQRESPSAARERVATTAREASALVGADVPTQHVAPDGVQAPGAPAADRAPTDVIAGPQRRESSAGKGSRNPSGRTKQERGIAAHKGDAPALIPGKRTNGLSLDEF